MSKIQLCISVKYNYIILRDKKEIEKRSKNDNYELSTKSNRCTEYIYIYLYMTTLEMILKLLIVLGIILLEYI